MKKTLFAIAALAATSAALANPIASAAAAESAPIAAKSPYVFELGLTTHQETYEEFNPDGSKLMQEKGQMTGIKGSVTRAIEGTGGKVVVTGEYAVGDSKYTGSYWGGSYGDLVVGGIGRSLFEVTGVYKHTAPEWNGVTAGAGLGYRRLQDNLQDAGPGGYERINERFYLTLSLEKAVALTDAWTVTPVVQYKHLLSSKQDSDLYGGISVDQKKGYGAELAVAFAHKGEKVNTIITPYYRMWKIKDSEVHGSGLYEPRNDTKEVGVALTFQF